MGGLWGTFNFYHRFGGFDQRICIIDASKDIGIATLKKTTTQGEVQVV